MSKVKYDHNIAGKKFNRLTAIRLAQPDECNIRNQEKWLCECECGNVVYVSFYKLLNGTTKSCGCWNRDSIIERSTKHGSAGRGKKERLYNIWVNMRARCRDVKNPRYKDYGAKGITVCDEWLDSFEQFKHWSLQNGYEENLTIDRKDVNKGYFPDNCRWITLEENSTAARALSFGVKETAISMMMKGATRREAADAVGVDISTTIRWAHEIGLM